MNVYDNKSYKNDVMWPRFFYEETVSFIRRQNKNAEYNITKH